MPGSTARNNDDALDSFRNVFGIAPGSLFSGNRLSGRPGGGFPTSYRDYRGGFGGGLGGGFGGGGGFSGGGGGSGGGGASGGW